MIFDTWSDALIYEVNDILCRLQKHNAFSEREAAALQELYHQNKPLLDEIKTPRLLHTDIWEGNVLLYRDTHRIAAVIDGDRAVFGDTDFEFSSP